LQGNATVPQDVLRLELPIELVDESTMCAIKSLFLSISVASALNLGAKPSCSWKCNTDTNKLTLDNVAYSVTSFDVTSESDEEKEFKACLAGVVDLDVKNIYTQLVDFGIRDDDCDNTKFHNNQIRYLNKYNVASKIMNLIREKAEKMNNELPKNVGVNKAISSMSSTNTYIEEVQKGFIVQLKKITNIPAEYKIHLSKAKTIWNVLKKSAISIREADEKHKAEQGKEQAREEAKEDVSMADEEDLEKQVPLCCNTFSSDHALDIWQDDESMTDEEGLEKQVASLHIADSTSATSGSASASSNNKSPRDEFVNKPAHITVNEESSSDYDDESPSEPWQIEHPIDKPNYNVFKVRVNKEMNGVHGIWPKTYNKAEFCHANAEKYSDKYPTNSQDDAFDPLKRWYKKNHSVMVPKIQKARMDTMKIDHVLYEYMKHGTCDLLAFPNAQRYYELMNFIREHISDFRTHFKKQTNGEEYEMCLDGRFSSAMKLYFGKQTCISESRQVIMIQHYIRKC